MKTLSLSFPLLLSIPVLVYSEFPSAFTLSVYAPGSHINGKPVNANGQAFWIGKPTASYCPDGLPPGLCAPVNQTVIRINQNVPAPCQENTICGSAAMDVIVPGGQQIYIDSSLALRFTIPHSGFIPAGSSLFNFSLSAQGQFGWNASDAAKATFSACPKGKRSDCDEVIYQIYGHSHGERSRFQRNRCLNNITLKAVPAEDPKAWEYI